MPFLELIQLITKDNLTDTPPGDTYQNPFSLWCDETRGGMENGAPRLAKAHAWQKLTPHTAFWLLRHGFVPGQQLLWRTPLCLRTRCLVCRQ